MNNKIQDVNINNIGIFKVHSQWVANDCIKSFINTDNLNIKALFMDDYIQEVVLFHVLDSDQGSNSFEHEGKDYNFNWALSD